MSLVQSVSHSVSIAEMAIISSNLLTWEVTCDLRNEPVTPPLPRRLKSKKIIIGGESGPRRSLGEVQLVLEQYLDGNTLDISIRAVVSHLKENAIAVISAGYLSVDGGIYYTKYTGRYIRMSDQ